MVVHLFNAVQGIKANDIGMPVIMYDHIHFRNAGDLIIDFDAIQMLCGEVMPVIIILYRSLITKLISLLSHIVERVQQESAGTAGRIYKDAVFDTNEKGLSRYTSAGKGQKKRAFAVPPVIPAELRKPFFTLCGCHRRRDLWSNLPLADLPTEEKLKGVGIIKKCWNR